MRFCIVCSFHTKFGKACVNPALPWVMAYINKVRYMGGKKKSVLVQLLACPLQKSAKMTFWIIVFAATKHKGCTRRALRQRKRVNQLLEKRRRGSCATNKLLFYLSINSHQIPSDALLLNVLLNELWAKLKHGCTLENFASVLWWYLFIM